MTQAFNLSQLANNLNTSGQLDATDGLTGAVPVANGGTGQTTLTANAVLIGNGTGGVQAVAPSTSGNVLTSNGSAWVSSTPTSSITGTRGQTFTSNGTFTIPTGISSVKVTVIGGGGGGGAGANNRGSNGGTSSVASGTQSISTISATGGIGGYQYNYSESGIVPIAECGVGSGGDLNIRGIVGSPSLGTRQAGSGGSSSLFGGPYMPFGGDSAGTAGGAGTGTGGAGGSLPESYVATGGGGGGTAVKYLTSLTSGNTLAVTIGSGGNGGSAGGRAGGAGGSGFVMFEW